MQTTAAHNEQSPALMRPTQAASGLPWWCIPCLTFAAALVIYWPLRTEYLYEADSVSYALAIERFDVAWGHPHPPGYPVWTAIAWCVSRLTGSANTAMILLSIVFTAGAGAFLYDLARRLQPGLGAWLVLGMFLLTPNVILYSAMATTYTVDLFTSAMTGWFAARVWAGEKRLAPVAGLLLGLLTGVRLQGVVFLGPLVVAAMVRSGGRSVRLWLVTGAAAFYGVASWFVPVALVTVGIQQSIVKVWKVATWICGYLGSCSVFSTVPAEDPWDRAFRVTTWLGISLSVPVVLGLGAWLLRRWRGLRVEPPLPPPSWHCPLFYAFWMLPSLGLIYFLHSPKPAYQNLCLPPLVLCLGQWLVGNARALGKGRLQGKLYGMAAFVAFAAGSLAVGFFPFEWITEPRLGRFAHTGQLASLRSLRDADATFRGLKQLLETEPRRDDRLPCYGFISTTDELDMPVPNWDKLMYYFREYPVSAPTPEGMVEAWHLQWHVQPTVPPQIRKIWWLFRHRPDEDRTFGGLPPTRLVWENHYLAVYCTDVSLTPLDGLMHWNHQQHRLHRDVAVEFGRGFSRLETTTDGRCAVWACGPDSVLRIALARGGRLRIAIDAAYCPLPGQGFRVSFNGQPAGIFSGLRAGQSREIVVDGDRGFNALVLSFNQWNGHPASFAPNDERPLAVQLRQITLELQGSAPVEILPSLPKSR